MNWYRFKVELSAWAGGSVLCTLTTVIGLAVAVKLSNDTIDMVHWTPREQFMHEHPWVFPTVLLVLAAAMWVSGLRALHLLRSDKRYGGR
jgi:hypothetical protein